MLQITVFDRKLHVDGSTKMSALCDNWKLLTKRNGCTPHV